MYPDAVRPIYGNFVQYQARELHRRGHDVIVISPQPYIPDIPIIPKRFRNLHKNIGFSKNNGGIKVIYPRTLSLPNPRTQWITALVSRFRSSAWTKHLKRDDFIPDIVNAHVAQPNGFASIPIAEHFEAPLVTTVHGADLNLLYKQFVNRKFINKTFDQSNAVIVNSNTLRQIAQEGHGTQNIHVVPNGIPIDIVNMAQNQQRPSKINDNLSTIVSVGNLIKSKGHHTVLEMLATLEHEVQYIIVGDGPQREALQQMVSELGLNQVEFIGEIPNEDVFRYLSHAQLFILPSYREAFGIAYIEAMACGLPVIACEGEGPEDFINHGENGFLIPKHDVEMLQRLTEELLRSPSYREEIGSAAQRTAREYTWEQNVDQVEQIYNSALN